VATGASRRSGRTLGRALQEGDWQAEYHVAGVCRRGAMLRVDRRVAEDYRRRELQDSVHATAAREHLEYSKHRDR